MHILCLASTVPKAKKFLLKPSDLMILHDENAILECIVTGYPKPQVEWYKDGAKITTQSGHYSKYGVSSLKVSSSKVSDGGKYECVMGSERAGAQLKVVGKNFFSFMFRLHNFKTCWDMGTSLIQRLFNYRHS